MADPKFTKLFLVGIVLTGSRAKFCALFDRADGARARRAGQGGEVKFFPRRNRKERKCVAGLPQRSDCPGPRHPAEGLVTAFLFYLFSQRPAGRPVWPDAERVV